MVANPLPNMVPPKLMLNQQEVGRSKQERHLGLERTDDGRAKATMIDRIKSCRRAVYSVAGAGLYGLNGIGTKATIAMIRT